MSWSASGLGKKAIELLEANFSYDHNANAIKIIQSQIDLVKAVLEKVPEGFVCVVDVSGHIDTYGGYQKVETRIYKS